MTALAWQEIGQAQYIAKIASGRAIIEPCHPSINDQMFCARLELPSGTVIAEQSCDLESAKEWARVSLPLLDQEQGELYECGHVWETLDLCQNLISLEEDAIHKLRLEYIKSWIARNTQRHYEIAEISLPKYQQVEFNWLLEANQSYADTPYGRAIIIEMRSKGIIGGGIQHKAQIVHHTGSVLDCLSWLDFLEAEHAIKQNLAYLIKPQIHEYLLECIHFTLDICDRLLPDDVDPIHSARLAVLGTAIHLALE